jgi:hypothetical protein
MPNGRPGDHPITDICTHRIAYFTPEIDELIRQCVDRGGTLRVEGLILYDERFSGPDPDLPALRAELEKILDELEAGETGA